MKATTKTSRILASSLALAVFAAVGCGDPSSSSSTPGDQDSDPQPASATQEEVEAQEESQADAALAAAEARHSLVADEMGQDVADKVVLREDRPADLVLELEVEEEHSVFFYELLPGVPYVGEKLRYPQSSVLPEDALELSMAELFGRLAPGQALPSALSELDARIADMASTYERLTQLDIPSEIAVTQFDLPDYGGVFAAQPAPEQISEGVGRLQQQVSESACPHDWLFQVAGCPLSGDDWVVQKPFITGSTQKTTYNIRTAHGGACSIDGTIRYRVRYRKTVGWTNFVDVELDTGDAWVGWDVYGGGNRDVRTKIDEATGDTFHYCMAGLDD